jgi:transcriptional regulator with GAF, ATPase, and Fis domain
MKNRRLRLLLDVTNALVSTLDLSGLIAVVSSSLQRAIPHEFTSLALLEEEGDHVVIRAGAFKSGPRDCREGKAIPLADSPFGEAFATRRTVLFSAQELRAIFDADHPLCRAGIRSLCCVPPMVREQVLGTLNVGSLRPGDRRGEVDEAETLTLKDIERAHIVRVLDEANWTLGGPHGAAARLGMKRTTLQSWIKRLGITRPAA